MGLLLKSSNCFLMHLLRELTNLKDLEWHWLKAILIFDKYFVCYKKILYKYAEILIVCDILTVVTIFNKCN